MNTNKVKRDTVNRSKVNGSGMKHQEAIGRIEDRSAKVVVVGQGYVGLAVAVRAVGVGFYVVVFVASVE